MSVPVPRLPVLPVRLPIRLLLFPVTLPETSGWIVPAAVEASKLPAMMVLIRAIVVDWLNMPPPLSLTPLLESESAVLLVMVLLVILPVPIHQIAPPFCTAVLPESVLLVMLRVPLL